MNVSWRRFASLAFIASAVTGLLLAYLGYQQWTAARWETAISAQVEQSRLRTEAVSSYLELLRDLETGQRGYLVTGDPAFLDPFKRAVAAESSAREQLISLYGANVQNAALAHQLLAIGSQKYRYARQIVALAEEQSISQARTRVAEGRGRRLMDQARSLADQIERNEVNASRAILSTNLEERQRRQSRLYLTQSAALIGLAVLLFALASMVRRLRENAAVLEDAATRQEAIFEGASDAMMMLDGNGTIESANMAAKELFGHPRRWLAGKSNLILFKDPPSPERSKWYLSQLANGKLENNRQIFSGLRADGSEIEAEVVTTPIRLADGLHFLAVMRDATQRRQVEKMKDEFIATVSHELRTPLTSVAGSLGLILGGAGGDIPDRVRRLVQIAQNNCHRLIRLINDMLDLEKIESGNVRFNMQPLDVGPVLDTAVSTLAPIAAEKSVALEIRDVPRLKVFADADRLIQVLTNLVSNAVKFSPADGIVTISVTENADRARFSVEDEGPGISEEFQARIFRKFAQADSSDTRDKGGTGLGLSIVKELVERMGGLVGFEGRGGKGTRFYFELPIYEEESAQVPSETLGKMEQEERAQILHVDDDPDTLRLVASAFEGRAIVHSSPSLQEAKASLQRYNFDALIIDIAMPEGSGFELVKLVQTSSRSDVPVIVYTALDRTLTDEPSTYARLTKSKADLGTLVTTVESALSQGRDSQ